LDWHCVREAILEQWTIGGAEWYSFVRLAYHVVYDIILALLVWGKGVHATYVFLPIAMGVTLSYTGVYSWYYYYPLFIVFLMLAVMADYKRETV